MKRLLAVVLAALAIGAHAQTLVRPLQGGTGVSQANTKTITLGGPLVTSGAFSTTFTATGTTTVTLPLSGTLLSTGSSIALTNLATQATNTVVGNATAGSASPTALAVGSCSTSGSALIWTTNTGFGCNTSIVANTADTVTNATQAAITSAANLATVGTITSGTWSGTAVAANKVVAGAASSGSWDVPSGGTGRATGTTAYSLVATGTTATGAQQTLANGATTEILVGGGASALPVWTTATGTGAPVRASGATLTPGTVGVGGPLITFVNAGSPGSGLTPISQVTGTANTAYQGIARFTADASGTAVVLAKSRGTTTSDFAVVQNNDTIGSVAFAAADGTDLLTVPARITAFVDGVPGGTSQVPGRLCFYTSSGTADNLTQRLCIDSAGLSAFTGTTSATVETISPQFRSTAAKVLVRGTGTGATQLSATQTTAPTCSTNCGTGSPTVTGTDTFMTVQMGSTGSPASGWVVTFNGTWAAAPACVVQMGKAGMVVGKQALTAVTTTTTITVVTNGTAPATGDIYHINCGGTQ